MCCRSRVAGALIALLVLSAVPGSAEEIVIVHANDTHSNLFPFGPQKAHGGIARIATVIERIRDENERVLSLHAGDVFVGTFAFNKYLGYPELKLMEGLYDAMALGNHEIEFGPAFLAAILAGVNPITGQSMGPPVALPILSANIDLDAVPGLQPFILPAIIKEVGGIKVGLLGVTTHEPVYYSPDVAALMGDPFVAAGVTAALLRAQGCQVVVAISHLGAAYDILGLSMVPGIDVIVGGHSHTTLPATQVNGKIIVQAGEFGRLLGELRIDVDAAAGVTLIDHRFHVIDRDIRDDPALIPYLNTLRNGIYTDPRYGPVLSQQVARAAWDLEKTWMVPDPNRGPSHRDTPLGNLVTDAIRIGVNRAGFAVDSALEATGLLGNKIFAGKVVANDVMMAVPYGYDPISGLGFRINVVSLYGAELLGALEHTLTFIEYSDEMAMQTSGLMFQYDSQGTPGTRLDAASVTINGRPVDPSAVYRLAVNERIVALLSSLGVDVSGRVEGTGLFEFNLVKDYMRELRHLHYTSEGRIIDVAALQ
jgi:5'-nucleotidase / UDP-sugar diphosphatase